MSMPRTARLRTVALCALLMTCAACADPAPPPTQSLRVPVDLTAYCVAATATKDDRPTGIAASPLCDTSLIWAFVTNAERGDIGIIDLTATKDSRRNVDTDRFVPGFTRIPIGGVVDASARSQSGAYFYFTRIDESGVASIDQLDISDWSGRTRRQVLPAPASQLLAVVAPDGNEYLLATLPTLGVVARVSLQSEASFGGQEPESLIWAHVGGLPSDLVYRAADEAESRVFVAQQSAAYLSVLAGESLARNTADELSPISLAPDCQDGLDNDGDGQVDSADWGCTGRLGDFEARDAEPPAACADGLDSDGDGLIDYPDDPGCSSRFDATEWSDAGPCTDGFDNDGNGSTDTGVECEPTSAGQEVAYGQFKPACSNGIDDDLDGFVDADDPECASRADSAETGHAPEALSHLALSLDGNWLYATHAGRREVVVINATTGQVVRINERSAPLGNPLLAHERVLGVRMPRAPAAIAFAPSRVRVLTSTGAQDRVAMTAFATTTAGEIFPIDAAVYETQYVPADTSGSDSKANNVVPARVHVDLDAPSTPYHVLRTSSLVEQTTATRPELFANGTQVEQAFRPAEGYLHVGAFIEDRDANLYSGIEVFQDERLVRGEIWELTHQGALPGSRRATGEVRGWTTVDNGDGTESTLAVFHDPWVDFCDLGVLPGDTLALRFNERITCAADSGWQADRVEFRIRDIQADTLWLEPGDYRAHCPDAPLHVAGSLIQAGGVAIQIPTAEERFERNLLDTTLGDVCQPVQLPSTTCFPGTYSYEITAPPGECTVIGSTSGYLHRQRNDRGQCVTSGEDERVAGRARLSVPSGVAPDSCGQYPLDDSYFSEEFPFRNFGFALTVRPGCEPPSETLLGEPIAARFVAPRRGTALRFRLRAGASLVTQIVGSVPDRLRYEDLVQRLYVVDPGESRILEVNPFSATLDAPNLYR